MKRPVAVVIAVAIVAIVLATLWAVYGTRIRTSLALRKCARAWERLTDYRSDFELEAEIGPLHVTVVGALAYKRPDSYRLTIGREPGADCVFMGSGRTGWVYFPGRKVAFEVDFGEADAPSIAAGQSLKPWVDQVVRGSDAELTGRETVEGRECNVLEVVPTAEAREGGEAALAPVLGRRFDLVPFLGDWKRSKVCLDRDTGLPIRGEALTASGAVLFRWTASGLQVNSGIPDAEFRFERTPGVKVRQRKYDPEHPEDLFVPPRQGKSLLDRVGDVVGEGAKQYLKDKLGDRDDLPQGLRDEIVDSLLD